MTDTEFENIMKTLQTQIEMAAKANRRKSKICILLNLDKQIGKSYVNDLDKYFRFKKIELRKVKIIKIFNI